MIIFYFLVLIMPLSQHRIWSQAVGEMTVFKYLGAACLLYAVLHLAARRAMPQFFRTWPARLFVAFYLIAGLSYVAGAANAQQPFLSYTSFLLLFLITLSVVDTMDRLRWVLFVAIGSVALGSLYVIREWQKYHDIYPGMRPGSVVGDANYFTVSALVCMPLAFYLMVDKRPRWERFFCFGCLIVTLAGVTLAASRGGFLGLIAGWLFIIWHSRRRVRNFIVACVLLVPLSLISPVSSMDRFLHPVHGDIEAAQIRTALWGAGWRMIQAHPLAGIGLGNFKPLAEQYALPGETLLNVAHSTYVEIAAELGVPALLVFLALLYSTYRGLGRVRRATFELPSSLWQQAALGFQAGLVGCAVSIFFVSGQYQKLLWLVIFLSICLSEFVAATATQRAQDDARPDAAVAGGAPQALYPQEMQS